MLERYSTIEKTIEPVTITGQLQHNPFDGAVHNVIYKNTGAASYGIMHLPEKLLTGFISIYWALGSARGKRLESYPIPQT